MADRRKSDQELSKSVQKLTESVSNMADRMDQLEERISEQQEKGTPDSKSPSQLPGLCAMPVVPEPEYPAEVTGHRLDLLRMFHKKWVNHTVLHYYFFKSGPFRGSSADIGVVREAFNVWKEVGIGLEFEEVTDISESEIRIGFQRGDGSWSYVGRDVLNIGQNLRTMNFGWKLAGGRSREDDIDTALHEIGHSLGFPHEHQNPNSGIEWNEEAVYRDLAGPPNNWSRDKTFYNIIRKLPTNEVEGSDWDSNSIMHYPFREGMINRPVEFQQGLNPEPNLSEIDIERVRLFYPPQQDDMEELRPLRSKQLSLDTGEQANFSVQVSSTRMYNFSTFGGSDTVAVLFEKVDDEYRFVAGDDDSGTSLNAQFSVRLRPHREYVLRIRLYSQYAEGETAVMMW